ncbi:hypothetical protein Neosp_012680 [[Neocosmospora] mangrovei]
MSQEQEISLQVIGQTVAGGGWTADLLKDGEVIQRSLHIADPLDAEGKAICRWYLQQYVQQFTFSLDRAAKAEALLDEYPRKLLRQLPLRQAVLSHFSDQIYSLTHTTISIDIYQRDIDGGDQPEDNMHQLFWETLESTELWGYPTWHIIVRRCMKLQAALPAPQPETINPWVDGDGSATINILLVVARDLTSHPSVYDDVSPSIATATLLKLRHHLNKVPGRMKLNVEVVRPGTFEAFKKHLQRTEQTRGRSYYHMVHFDMHGRVGLRKGSGSKYAMLYFSKSGSFETAPTPGVRVGKVLKTHGIPFAVLNACESARASDGDDANIAKLFLKNGLRGVIGMSFKISSSSVGLFLDRFYWLLLAQGASFAASAAAGRDALRSSPMRPARYGSQRHLNDSFVAVVYEDGSDPALSWPTLQSDLGSLGFGYDANWYHLHHHNAFTLGSNVQELLPDSALVGSQIPLLKQDLVGRDFELLRLEKVITEHRLLYLSGLAGVGKTVLVKHAASTWKSTNFVQFTVYIDFDKEALKTGQDLLEEMLRQFFMQDPSTQQAGLWSMTSRSLLSYGIEELENRVMHILSRFNTAVILEDLEPAPLPLDMGKILIEEISPIVKRLLGLAREENRSTQLYVILTSRRKSPHYLEAELDHELGKSCYDLGGLGLPDAIELSKGILQKAGEPVDEWRSEDADWLESVIHLVQGIPSVLLDILPLQQSRGIPWRQFFKRLHQGIFLSRAEIKKDRLEECAASKQIYSTLFTESYSLLLCLGSIFWHEAVSMKQLIGIFLDIADDPLKEDFQHGRGGGTIFWNELFYGFVDDRGFIREDQKGILHIHPMLTIIGRGHLYDSHINLSNRVLLQKSIGTSMEVCPLHLLDEDEAFPANVFNLLSVFEWCTHEVPASQWPLNVLGSPMRINFTKLPLALRAHLQENQFTLLKEMSFKFPLIEDKVGHASLYALTLLSFCFGERDLDRATWKRVLETSAKGHPLVASLSPDDDAEAVKLCRGCLLAASIVSAHRLREFDQAHTSWKSLQLLQDELGLPTLPPLSAHTTMLDLEAIQKAYLDETGPTDKKPGFGDPSLYKFLLASILSGVESDMKKWEQGESPITESLDKESDLEKRLASLLSIEAINSAFPPGIDCPAHVLELILFNRVDRPLPPVEPNARRKLADLEEAYDAGEWIDTCERHLALALNALMGDQFEEATSHLESIFAVAEMAPASPSLLLTLHGCQKRMIKATWAYLCHTSIFLPKFFDRGSGYGFARQLDKELHLSSIDERFWATQALIWPSRECLSDKRPPSKWWQWWEWLLESQGQGKTWVTYMRANLGLYLEQARLMDHIFIFSGHNNFEKALSLLSELELACNDTVFTHFATHMSPLQSIRDCLELALEQSLIGQKLAAWNHSCQLLNDYRALIDDLACLGPTFCSWLPNKSIEGFRFAAERFDLLRYQVEMRDKSLSVDPAELREVHQDFVLAIEQGRFARLDVNDVLAVRCKSLELMLDKATKDRRWKDGIKYCDEHLMLTQSSEDEYLGLRNRVIGVKEECHWHLVREDLEEAENDLDFNKCVQLLDQQMSMHFFNNMPDDPAIRLWLNDISDGPPESHVAIDPSEATSCKRKSSQQRAPSVSTEEYTENMSAISKKRKMDNQYITFRAEDMKTGTMHNPPPRPSLESSELSEAITTKTISETSSFWCEMRRLPADDAGLEYQELNVDAPPPVAANLVQFFGELSKGIGVLPYEAKEDITSYVQQQKDWSLQPWKMAFLEKGDESNATLPGSVPTWEDLFNLCLQARDCFIEGHDGTSWKLEVHYGFLKKIFRTSGAGHDGSLDFMSW